MSASKELEAPLIGIVRHRLETDGDGVTTLVAFHSCPLRCRYCLNRQCLEPDGVVRTITPAELVQEVGIDNLYFLATGGGVTFGGGEPLNFPHFIEEFGRLKEPLWKVSIESSLNVPWANVERVVPIIDQYMIDIKDTDPEVYQAYTGRDNRRVLDNLERLLNEYRLNEKIIVRLPLIPEYNTAAHVARSRECLERLGVTRFDEFEYQIR